MGLEKYLKPYGFWDTFLTANLMGLMALGLLVYSISAGNSDATHFYGTVAGLIAGQILICSFEASRVFPHYAKYYQILYTVLFFGFLPLFALFPKRAGVGYLLGMYTTGLFGVALVALVKKMLHVRASNV